MAAERKRRGCLSGLMALAVASAAVAWLWFALTNPWIYTVGGGRVLPLWQGSGTIAGPGGTYRLYVGFSPSTGSTARPSTWAKGYGWVCAPGGRSYSVHVSASTDSVVWREMDGAPFHLYTHGSNSFAGLNRGELGPPVIDLRGAWRGDSLMMSDNGTLASAFAPDGSLRRDRAPPTPAAAQPIVLTEGLWGLSNPCAG